MHEEGLVLGIRSPHYKRVDDDEQRGSHPQIRESAVSYSSDKRYRYSPHPFDVMAIYALYQTYQTK